MKRIFGNIINTLKDLFGKLTGKRKARIIDGMNLKLGLNFETKRGGFDRRGEADRAFARALASYIAKTTGFKEPLPEDEKKAKEYRDSLNSYIREKYDYQPVLVVFDGYHSRNYSWIPGRLMRYSGRKTADDLIVDIISELPDRLSCDVVTCDKGLIKRIREAREKSTITTVHEFAKEKGVRGTPLTGQYREPR